MYFFFLGLSPKFEVANWSYSTIQARAICQDISSEFKIKGTPAHDLLHL
jgi:hypothetical protein